MHFTDVDKLNLIKLANGNVSYKTELILGLKSNCDTRFQRAVTACFCVFKVITLV